MVSAQSVAPPGVSDRDLAAVRAVEKARVETVNKVYGTVVAIYGKTRQGGGSGVLYDPRGYALTNYHVVRATGPEGWAGLADGKLYPFKVIGLDPGGDVAIIKLDPPKDHPADQPFTFPYAELGDSDTVRVGDFAMAMGNPFVLAEDHSPTVTLGIVSGVNRYQEGQGGTSLLEYGDCIQIDSSINPGNSGGPLFNMRGEVIGINGRGSFEERGRVNVGVGYAISINQIRRFIPDMLATKVAMHATLNASFGTRGQPGDEKTVCERLDLDSQLAKLGMELGDRLVRFDGRDVTSANQFTNHLSTLPAGWPVEVVWEHDGALREAWLRLDARPYPKQPPRPQRPQRPRPGGEDEDRPPEQEPVEPPQTEPGKIRDADVNRREALRILEDWVRFQGGREALEKVGAVRRVQRNQRGESGEAAPFGSVVVAADGRFRWEWADHGPEYAIGQVWDGKTYWYRMGDAEPTVLRGEQALAKYDVAVSRMKAALSSADPMSHLAQIELRGGDKVDGRVAYRLLVKDKQGRSRLFWFSVFDDAGAFETRLVKVADFDEATGAIAGAVLLDDYRRVGGVMVPYRERILRPGVQERVQVTLTAESVEVLREVPEGVFDIPQ